MSNLIAHRALDDSKYKENTKDAIIAALNKSYIKGIEIDVRITKDNKIVLIHDSIINRTSNGSGIVEAMTLKKLGKYNFGTKDNPCKISTLKEMLRILPNDKIVLIEIKCHSEEDRFIDCFYDTIKNFLDNWFVENIEDTGYSSFVSDDWCRRCRSCCRCNSKLRIHTSFWSKSNRYQFACKADDRF